MLGSPKINRNADSWPHRFAIMLAVVTLVLIWIGGLVTTTNAGMAVPDWPTTYGYNLFLYPWQTWIAGPRDLLIEHGHRLFGALAGILTISVLLLTLRYDQRRWVQWYAFGLLAAVVVQGGLGGFRVLLDDRMLAMIHGCTGPLFFAMTAAMCVFTSPYWKTVERGRVDASAERARQWLGFTCAVVYLQIVIGAFLRHLPADASPQAFRVAVMFHLFFALVVTGHVLFSAWMLWRSQAFGSYIRWPAAGLASLIFLQLVLGAASWVVKYSWPAWPRWVSTFGYSLGYTTIEAGGIAQSLIVTSHVAVGSLIFALSTVAMLRTLRATRASRAECCGQSAKASIWMGGVVA